MEQSTSSVLDFLVALPDQEIDVAVFHSLLSYRLK